MCDVMHVTCDMEMEIILTLTRVCTDNNTHTHSPSLLFFSLIAPPFFKQGDSHSLSRVPFYML